MESNWIEECRDSDANSASRNRPGIMYVKERRADSICVTELWFLVMKSPYMLIHLGGNDMAFGTCLLAILRDSIIVEGRGGRRRVKRKLMMRSGERLGINLATSRGLNSLT